MLHFYAIVYDFFPFCLDNDKYFKYTKTSKRRLSDDRLPPIDSNLELESLLCQYLTKERLQCPGALSRERHNQPKSLKNIVKNIQSLKELDCLTFKKVFIPQKCYNIKSVTENKVKFHKNCQNKMMTQSQNTVAHTPLKFLL